MNVKKFNQLKKDVKGGNIEGLKEEVIKQLTLKQAQAIEDLMYDLKLTDEANKVLDEIVKHIVSMTTDEKVANKKAPKKEEKKEEKKEPEKKDKEAPKKVKPFKKVNVGDVVKFQVEGEEVKHDIKIIYKGKNNIIAIMVADEREVFNIRKTDFNKEVFEWTDRYGESYNIIVIL